MMRTTTSSRELSRRGFLSAGVAASSIGLCPATSASSPRSDPDLMRRFLAPYVLKRDTIDQFLDPRARVWAKFDPELGYLLRNSFVRDGMDGSHTLARYEDTGQRKQVNFPDQPCRINTYGNSFTQGHQVSDGETWQEILAAHFCEPIRNFGIGGFGVYQAYRRLIRTEATELAAPFVILNIWGDDHYRSIYSWRWLSFPPRVVDSMTGMMFHANPWCHARLDPASGDLMERDNPCPNPESLYMLCDPDFVFETFGKDEIAQAIAAGREGVVAHAGVLERMAEMLDAGGLDLGTPDQVRASANRLLHAYATTVGMKIVERLKAYCDTVGKKLLVLLSYPMGSVWNACEGNPPGDSPGHIDWHPRVFKDHLGKLGIPFVDTITKHVAEFRTFKLTAKEYVDRYYIGHYTPRGNHFFAYAIKDELLAWLDPKPPAYRLDDEPLIRFKGYLPG